MPEAFYTRRSLSSSHFGLQVDVLTNRPRTSCIRDRSIEGWNALVKKPQDRIGAVRPTIEKLGGKIENAFFAFGDYDVVLIVRALEGS